MQIYVDGLVQIPHSSMEKFLYLLLAFITLIIWGLIYLKRRDLRTKMLLTSIFGAIAGLLAELWYFRDYWKPISLNGEGTMSIEDAMMGFAIVGISTALYDVVSKQKDVETNAEHKQTFLALLAMGSLLMMLGTNMLGWNSVIVSEIIFLLTAAAIVWVRQDLLIPCLLSGVLLTILMMPIYLLIFKGISPSYWQQHWLLAGTPLGKTMLSIPITEIVWYFSWGCLGGIVHNFVEGTSKEPL